MEIQELFIKTINNLSGKPTLFQTEYLINCLNSIEITDIANYFIKESEIDLYKVMNSIHADPPVVIPICKHKDYVMELTYWYPLHFGIDTDEYDPEDIHNHFGYLVTKMLLGEGYKEFIYKESEENKVELESIHFLKQNMTNTISPKHIHRIVYESKKASLSIRIFLPNSISEMKIYDKHTFKLINVLKAPNEKRKYDFAGFLSLLDKDLFSETIEKINENCLLETTKEQLKKLCNL